MKHLIYILLCMTVVGCASTTDNATAKQTDTTQVNTVAAAEKSKETPKEELICKTEKKLGSNQRTRVCRLKDNAHDTAIRNRQVMDDLGANR